MNNETFTIPDDRWHEVDGKRYPRVTSVLQFWPRGWGYEKWLGNAESYEAAMRQRDEAGERGTFVHATIERLIAGEEIDYDSVGNPDTWRFLESFANFWAKWKPVDVCGERMVHSKKLGTAGSFDRIIEIPEIGRVLADWKTSSAIHFTHKIQVSAYREMWNALFPKQKVDEAWIVRLGSKHKDGFELVRVKDADEHKKLVDCFKTCKKIWDTEMGDEPSDKTYRKSIKL